MEYCLDNGVLSVRVSSLGGELQSVKKDGREYLWQGDPAYWEGKAPNLFPYIARLTRGTCTVHGKAYQLPIHGFLPTTEMTAEAQEAEREEDSNAVRLVLRLDADERTLACYPFVFTLRIVYELEGDSLRITYEVTNGEKEEMYFGIGGHPGFQVPLEDGLSFEDYFLEFETAAEPDAEPDADGPKMGERLCGAVDQKGEAEGTQARTAERPCGPQEPVRVGFSPACFLNGKDEPYPLQGGSRIPLGHELFDDDAIVLSGTPKTVVLRSEKGSRGVRVRFPGMPYIGFWHAVKKPAPYVCIEPWSSLPSRQDVVEELSEQPGLIHLEGEGVYRNTWSIQIF
ncbi:MAG TPA: aldose 1-epimerase family protein [Candidatus Eisenbergiella merdavium]|uniref:Aldose 1-epimerase family protein n=1 Tax=Candidatus Eisenbergiella merdavium TaxID=2838551 RepID=A0A9D2SNA0_9FIRM|nr:aldose 1-epimerase family protein [Candidatus Eisenbergiella merdavium]